MGISVLVCMRGAAYEVVLLCFGWFGVFPGTAVFSGTLSVRVGLFLSL